MTPCLRSVPLQGKSDINIPLYAIMKAFSLRGILIGSVAQYVLSHMRLLRRLTEMVLRKIRGHEPPDRGEQHPARGGQGVRVRGCAKGVRVSGIAGTRWKGCDQGFKELSFSVALAESKRVCTVVVKKRPNAMNNSQALAVNFNALVRSLLRKVDTFAILIAQARFLGV